MPCYEYALEVVPQDNSTFLAVANQRGSEGWRLTETRPVAVRKLGGMEQQALLIFERQIAEECTPTLEDLLCPPLRTSAPPP